MRGLIAATIMGVVFATGSATAAPQMLGVVAAGQNATLQCDGPVCTAELSTICLQENRETPTRHYPYTAVNLDDLSLIASTESGDMVQLPLRGASFRSERGYTAVTVTIGTQDLLRQGLAPKSLVATEFAAFVPVSEAGDPNPLSDAEVDFVMRELKPASAKVFAENSTAHSAIGIVNRLVNETPRSGRMTSVNRATLWERTMGETPRESTSAGAARAADIYGYCQYRTKQGRFFSVRRCLEQRLDSFLMDLNATYWQSVTPGS